VIGSTFTLFIVLLLALSLTSCSKSDSGGGKSINSATELKEYLDKQPANSPDQPIKVAMKANDMMIRDIAEVIKNAGKYVSLDLSGSPLTEIPQGAFNGCKTLAGITIPNSVTSIGYVAFEETAWFKTWFDNQPDGVVYLGKVALVYKGTMPANTSIKLNDGTTGIADRAFEDCKTLVGITIPSSVASIGEYAFLYCSNLTSVTFEGTITSDNFKSGDYYWYSYIMGDLPEKYRAGGPGTYTTTDRWDMTYQQPRSSKRWTKQ
jgi:hypothetical protein